jgi:transcriptional regulator with XRE-family HTH domain
MLMVVDKFPIKIGSVQPINYVKVNCERGENMSLGQKLMELRKEKHLSQEEVADKLNVTRQSVSKWETDQSTPDFDKILPICELFGITTEELITGKKEIINNVEGVNNIIYDTDDNKQKRTGGLAIGILLYFVAVAWIVSSIAAFKVNPLVATSIFLIICGVATSLIVFTQIVYKKKLSPEEEKKQKLFKQVDSVLALVFTAIYFIVSFATFAWHITWIIFILYALASEIAKLVLSLRSDDNE